MSVRRDFWRLIVWNGAERVGYAKVDSPNDIAFVANWKAATTFDAKRDWDEVRRLLRARGSAWSSTALNAPRTIRETQRDFAQAAVA